MGMYQIMRTLLRRNAITNLKRFIHNKSSNLLIPLSDKKLLRVEGQDSQEFLQGLVTNDMRHFDEGARSVFAMFLNNKGRVLYDTLIHKGSDEHLFLVECDIKVAESLRKYLNVYKLKRAVKIDLDSVPRVWALLSESGTPECNDAEDGSLVVYRDPRLLHLGSRLITFANISPPRLLDMVGHQVKDVHFEDPEVYRYLRYKLGVGEGAEDFPPGTCFPLEVNCDYLHGVSFHKGCYIGQELTARVHHTGVVRKRLMPIKFKSIINEFDLKDIVIRSGKDPAEKSNLGKLKGLAYNYGLGLVRIKEALDAKTLKIGDHFGEVVRPSWWPMEAPKELQSNKIDN